MKNNKPIERICALCHKKQDTNGMVRVVRVGKDFLVQNEKRLNGRGCHICPDCVLKAIEKKALNRSFKTQVPDKIYEELRCKAKKEKTFDI